MKYRLVSLLSLGHMMTDMTQGAIPVLLPLLIPVHHLTYAAAAGIVFAGTVVSSVVQPLFGHFADRLSKPWLVPGGVLLAGVGAAAIGLAPSYNLVLLVVGVSGLGVAAYHPEAARLTNYVAAENKATAMSIFGMGGQLGFAVGPILTTALVLWLGLRGTIVLALPGILVGTFLAWQVSQFSVHVQAAKEKDARLQGRESDQWAPFLRLTGVIFCRSVIIYGLNTFLPLYWINVLHQSNAAGGTALTLFFAAGVVGNMLGGRLGDTFGLRGVVLAGFCGLIILLPLFVSTQNVLLASLLLVAVGLFHFMTYSPMVLLAQKYLPNRVGLASGVTFGLAVTIGGLMSPLLGMIADRHGIRSALWCVAFLPLLAVGLSLTLPQPRT